jgi:hypothetical protein
MAKNFRRILKKAHGSNISRSAPSYSNASYRAIEPAWSMGNLPRERAKTRGGARFILQTDVSQFYPSLYTHAIGWSIDSALREKANWKNAKYLGKKIDQILMNLQAKESQGIPIGNDISFLLAETVLAQVDKKLGIAAGRGYRWFDDYEIACDTLEEAGKTLSVLRRELRKFRLRTNPAKTRIVELPKAADDGWRVAIVQQSRRGLASGRDMVQYFDCAFRLAETYPNTAVLNYAIGVLFANSCPSTEAGAVAESGMSQALLAEPGCAQKVFAVLTYWILNGYTINQELISRTIDTLIARHAEVGVTSDVAWSLSFCAENGIPVSKRVGKLLTGCDDDCIALQTLDLSRVGLIPSGFSTAPLEKLVGNADLDGPHWLLTYEAARHGFLNSSAAAVAAHPLFAAMMARGVTFLRRSLPPYSVLLHPGGAPNWLVRQWYERATGLPLHTDPVASSDTPVAELVVNDAALFGDDRPIADEFRLSLMGIRDRIARASEVEEAGDYS